MEGFKVEVLDEEQNQMAETDFRVSISGISEPTTFSSYFFNYVDFPHSGQVATH